MIETHNRKCEDCGKLFQAPSDKGKRVHQQVFKCPTCRKDPPKATDTVSLLNSRGMTIGRTGFAAALGIHIRHGGRSR